MKSLGISLITLFQIILVSSLSYADIPQSRIDLLQKTLAPAQELLFQKTINQILKKYCPEDYLRILSQTGQEFLAFSEPTLDKSSHFHEILQSCQNHSQAKALADHAHQTVLKFGATLLSEAASFVSQDDIYLLEDEKDDLAIQMLETKLQNQFNPDRILKSLEDQLLKPTATLSKDKCNICHKKLGLTTFTCKCGGYFCAKHRYNTEHSCSYDFKAEAKRELEKKNPRVEGDKIKDRI